MFETRYPVPGESPGLLRPRDEATTRRPVISLVAIFQIVYFKRRRWL